MTAVSVAAGVGCAGAPLPSSHSPQDPANPCAPEAAMDIGAPTPAQAEASSPNEHSGMSEADAGVVYTCPMHPEVQQSAPGRCPKCGTTLVVKKP